MDYVTHKFTPAIDHIFIERITKCVDYVTHKIQTPRNRNLLWNLTPKIKGNELEYYWKRQFMR